ncbi:hypothetical protein PR202_ga22320 [Eleusine coracana subsp. coracana]|uniref:non-specific serine/threonine protein kinase n=1 Tax=Eleusine coracana subsp. coracana TaxID=191504 RepID=A0AAV5D3Q4_ELECO|nr:hypothetical protein PR202_ga22320 [Eleusine coracana subsp. coracana]
MDSLYTELDDLERIVDGHEEPKHLSYPLLRLVTENFSTKRKINGGGCSQIFKGILRNAIIAVKMFASHATMNDKMFHQEVRYSMMAAGHKNIVRFLGYCSHTEERAVKLNGNIIVAQKRERFLCFEYLCNGSLEKYINDELRGLDWHSRFQIIKGICDGLHYLHKEKGIIHMDIKPANVLFDNCMVPKIIDFGLSRSTEETQTRDAHFSA